MVVLKEDTIRGVLRKNKSIFKLFPDFTQKVQGVRAKGRPRLLRKDKGFWLWETPSASVPGKTYKQIIKFKNIEDALEKVFSQKISWSRVAGRVLPQSLGKRILPYLDMAYSCTCPAMHYWGFHYILTKRDSYATAPENRYPEIRNPHLYGSMCKHLFLVLQYFPFYTKELGEYFYQFYPDIIQRLEAKYRAQMLGRRKK